jgi:hypothetical protein
MWIVSLIPENIFVIIYYTLISAGITLYIVSKLVTWIPMITQWKLPMELVGVIALAAGAYFMGGYGVQKAWLARVAELEEKVKAAEAKSAVVNTVVQEKIVYKTKIVKEVQIQIEERIKEVEKIIDAECKVDPIAIQILNDAAAPVGEAK